MKITVIYGNMRKECTYNCVQEIIKKVKSTNDEVNEFFLPKDSNLFCNGCFNCIIKDEKLCNAYQKINPIVNSLDNSDLIILSSPVYVYDVSGQMKAFLDHFAYRWMIHRPEKKMFKKTAIVVSTAAGAGTKHTNKTMKKSLQFWGVKKIYSFGFNVASMSWKNIDERKKQKILSKIELKSKKIIKSINSKKNNTNFHTKLLFFIMKKLNKKANWNPKDYEYWNNNGWHDGKKPWKN